MAGSTDPRTLWELADDFPLAPPPPGVTPNFDNPPVVGNHFLTITNAVCMGLLILFAAARLYSKLCLIRKITVDDYFFCLGFLCLISMQSLFISGYISVYEHHAWDLKVKDMPYRVLQVLYITIILPPVAACLIKITLLCMICNAFKSVKTLRRLCYGGMVITTCYYLSDFIITVVSCSPRGGTDRIAYLSGIMSKKCSDSSEILQKDSIATGIFSIISDFYILVIPLPTVIKLKLSRNKRIGVLMIFSSGGLACIASILALVFRFRYLKSKDVTVDGLAPIAAKIELSIGLYVSCVAPVSKLIQKILLDHCPMIFKGHKESYQSHAFMYLHAPKPKRRHEPDGLSELDSMKTCGTITGNDEPMGFITSAAPDVVGRINPSQYVV